MNLAEKFKSKYPEIIDSFEKSSVKISTEKLDNILQNNTKYNLRFTKIYSDFTYESFINESLEMKNYYTLKNFHKERTFRILKELERDITSEGKEEIEFYARELKKDENFIYEISEISEVFVAYILNYILEENDSKYNENLKMILLEIKKFSSLTYRLPKKFTLEDAIIKFFKHRFRTLKIKSQKEREYDFFKSLKNSYLFDFMCKFDIVLTTQTKENNELFMKTDNYSEKYDEKKILDIDPKKSYSSDLIIHFKKAMSSNDIATQYLSFYHIIEYYFDSLYNEYIISEMKGWLADPQLSLDKGSDILKFVDKAKKFKGKSSKDGQGNESDALRLVLDKYVKLDKLTMKLRDNYTKERVKKIYGVNINETNILEFYRRNSVKFLEDNLNIDFNSKDSACSNIRKRIYNTRNSLVHNKDSYNLKKYHPYDDEEELRKEIPLIKMIAMEIIINTSNDIDIDNKNK